MRGEKFALDIFFECQKSHQRKVVGACNFGAMYSIQTHSLTHSLTHSHMCW